MSSYVTTLPLTNGRAEVETRIPSDSGLVESTQPPMGNTLLRVTGEDTDELIALGALMHAESTFSMHPYNHDCVRNMVHMSVSFPNRFLGLIMRNHERKAIGFFSGMIQPLDFCNIFAAYDRAFYIIKGERSIERFTAMMVRYRAWAKENHAKDIFLGGVAQPFDERIYKLFEMFGFKYAGRMHRLTIGG